MAQRHNLRYAAQSGCVPNQQVFGSPGETEPIFWLVGLRAHSLKVFIYWNGRGEVLQISEQKLYRNHQGGGISRCGYQQKVKRAILRKFLISDTPLIKATILLS